MWNPPPEAVSLLLASRGCAPSPPRLARRYNIAASSAYYGFWYDAPDDVLYTSLGNGNFTITCPSRTPMLEFYNNVAYSNKR